MATFIPEPVSPHKAAVIASARRRAEQRVVAAELREAIKLSRLSHVGLERALGLAPRRLARLLACDSLWPCEPSYFRARVLAAIAAAELEETS